jgi:hypothetical protein
MCQEHHDRYDSTTSQTKGLTIGEVKYAREKLAEFLAIQEAAIHQAALPPPPTLAQVLPKLAPMTIGEDLQDHLRRSREQSLEWNRQMDEVQIEQMRRFMR